MGEAKYQAGTCNIDKVESKKRLAASIAGFFNAAIITGILFIASELTLLYGVIFLLNFTGFIGYLQYRGNFCAGLALKKKFHVGEEEEKIDDPEKMSKDRKQAALILFESAVLAGLLTAAITLIITNF